MTIQSQIHDALTKGDSLFSIDTNNTLVHEASKRYKDLSKRVDILNREIEKKQQIIDRVDRDFSDVHDSVPQPEPKKMVNVFEDYTMALVVISYLFMVISFIYLYTVNSSNQVMAFIQSFVGSTVITLGMSILLYYIV